MIDLPDLPLRARTLHWRLCPRWEACCVRSGVWIVRRGAGAGRCAAARSRAAHVRTAIVRRTATASAAPSRLRAAGAARRDETLVSCC
eukprot:3930778-Rhodomonas_salina.2